MVITLIIVVGLVMMTLIAAGGDYLSKRSKMKGNDTSGKMTALEKRIIMLEQLNEEKRDKIERIEKEMSFMNKFLEDKRQ